MYLHVYYQFMHNSELDVLNVNNLLKLRTPLSLY